MMNDPIPISKEGNSGWTADEKIKYEQARHTRNMQTGFLVVLGVILLSFFVPLGVFLTRLAMGA